jgi:hypothetical protein
VLNNPLALIDPDGHASELPCNFGGNGPCIGTFQDPNTSSLPPAKKPGDSFPVASCLGCGSQFGIIAGVDVFDYTPASTTSDVLATSVDLKPVLQTSALDDLPVYGSTRQFLFNYTTHNFEGALLSFGHLALDLSPLGFWRGAGTGLSLGLRGPAAAEAGLNGFQHASTYGIRSYNTLHGMAKGTGLQVHHLVEKRFANLLGIAPGKMKSIVLTPTEHAVFTKAWRKAIPYGAGTANATKQQLTNAARQIYANYPAIRSALGIPLMP